MAKFSRLFDCAAIIIACVDSRERYMTPRCASENHIEVDHSCIACKQVVVESCLECRIRQTTALFVSGGAWSPWVKCTSLDLW